MDLREKAQQVRGLFLELDKEIQRYRDRTGIRCIDNCLGWCCNRRDVYTTVLEFLPLAFEIFSSGRVEQTLAILEDRQDNICIFYRREIDGRCSKYENRGLICRLFGFSSIIKKDGSSAHVTCRFIKEKYRQLSSLSDPDILTSHYYRRLQAIDIRLTQKDIPINEAILSAINMVGIHLRYQSILQGSSE